MKLQELKNYHSHCLVCSSELDTYVADVSQLNCWWTEQGLLVETRNMPESYSVRFNFDGTYTRNSKNLNKYRGPLTVVRECPQCAPVPNHRSFASTSVERLKDTRWAYAFTIYGDAHGNFDAIMIWQDIKVILGDNFYHVNTNWSANRSETLAGNFKVDSLLSMINLTTAAINTSKLTTVTDLVNKLKIYNLFS